MATIKKRTKKSKVRKIKPTLVEETTLSWDDQPAVQRDLNRFYNEVDLLRARIITLESSNKTLTDLVGKHEGQIDIIVKFAGK